MSAATRRAFSGKPSTSPNIAMSASSVSIPVGTATQDPGLLVPDAATFLVGAEARRMLLVSALFGAVFLVLADLVARLVIAPSELPVGVLTALVGGPLFLVMLRRERRERRQRRVA
ncbi:iron chelate uptake ABC transporter family permease subunit [Saccharopolyspora spinosa]|uniref:iron chelate uptake ABC transporter family permease subunit n=1 Tax=Saccharopolyspora spinosa TaxID=60894 RepID=UPI000237B3CD|nr:iron chelate uptake ABC transporter family permease subunit [Saccharopolyspora spinosa]